ncbi:MAG: hypothetical protein OEU26_24500 [Candidatus Tectomicrobia bacterium]|nr:hypothetical protein [Candidatus Tectomicrobia bacterium]
MALINRIIGGALVGLMMLFAMGGAEAAEINFTSQDAGSFVSTDIDTDGDGSTAIISTTAGQSNVGAINQQMVIEVGATPTPNPACGAGQAGFPLVQATSVTSIRTQAADQDGVTPPSTNALLEARSVSGVICGSDDLATSTYVLQMMITGGTGQFAGATGTLTVQGESKFLLLDTVGTPFGSMSNTVAGTVTTVGN